MTKWTKGQNILKLQSQKTNILFNWSNLLKYAHHKYKKTLSKINQYTIHTERYIQK